MHEIILELFKTISTRIDSEVLILNLKIARLEKRIEKLEKGEDK
jgi:hypothetical protein